jgi:hypothetical protein
VAKPAKKCGAIFLAHVVPLFVPNDRTITGIVDVMLLNQYERAPEPGIFDM